MIATAEPHYAVSKPSQLVILENTVPKGPVAVQAADVFFTGDSGRYYSEEKLPDATTKDWAKQPIELLGARRAVRIAQLARADEFARKDLADAQSLAKAETSGSPLTARRPSSSAGRDSRGRARARAFRGARRAEAHTRRDAGPRGDDCGQ